MIKSLKRKFVMINMTIVTVLLLIIFALVYQSTSMGLAEQSQELMASVLSGGRTMGALSGLTPGNREVNLPYFYVSVNPFGEITVARSAYFDLNDGKVLAEILLAAAEAPEDTGILKAYNLRFSRRTTALGQAMVFVDMTGENATLASLVRTCVLIGVLSLGLFLGVSFLLARWAVRPVEKAWNQQRQFVADASHELKTPLTVIMTNAELLGDSDCGREQREKSAAGILTMARQMRGLVESLLELARVDNGTAKMEFGRQNFSQLAAETLLLFEPVYFERDLELRSDIAEELYVNGSAGHLRQVADILLDNAAKYASPGGEVAVALSRQGSHCLFSVASPGEEISREDLKNIFRRFYRVDKARSGGSYGLGLAIAQSIVSEHGGKIWAESGGGKNTFFVQLPLDG